MKGGLMKTHVVTARWKSGSSDAGRAKKFFAESAFLALLGVAIVVGGVCPAGAIPIETADGELTGSLDTTLTTGGSVRVSDRNYDVIRQRNGGRSYSINSDDATLNWGQWDFVSLSARATHELELNWKNYGFFGRAYYFYDAAVMDIGTDRTHHVPETNEPPPLSYHRGPKVKRPHLTRSARRRAGWDVELLDYYLSGNFDVAEKPLTVRFGSQVINWGESTFIQNGINVINPVDVSQLRVAGAELRDALIPVPAIDLSLALNDQLSVEGFYQFYWDHTEIEPLGTFFSTSDIASPGGQYAFLRFGQSKPGYPMDELPLEIPTPPLFGNFIPRGRDKDADRQGEGGLALRYFAPQLNDSEFGLYWVHYHSRLPLISGRTGEEAHAADGTYAYTGRYFREFPENIDLIGVSFNTEPYTSFALQGEVSYKFGQPLQVDDVELLFSALSAANPTLFPDNELQLGSYGPTPDYPNGRFETYVPGYRRKDVVQAQSTLTYLLGPTFGADQIIFLGEAGATWILDMENKNELRYEAPGTFTSGNSFYSPGNYPFLTSGIQPETENGYSFADRFSWGYQLVARMDFLGAVGPVNLFPIVAFQHDVEGTTPSPIVNFIDDRKIATARLDASYLESWRASLAYTNYFDGKGPHYNLLSDRDFLSLSASYSF